MRYQAVIVNIWHPDKQQREYIVELYGGEIYRSYYLDECESFCEEHDYDYDVIDGD